MSKPTQNVLLKEPKNNSVQPNDRLQINDSFVSTHYRIKVRPIREKSDNHLEQKETQNQVENDRRGQIDAAIVRIMKAHKTMEHTPLITEVRRIDGPHRNFVFLSFSGHTPTEGTLSNPSTIGQKTH